MTLCVTSDAELEKCVKMKVTNTAILVDYMRLLIPFFFPDGVESAASKAGNGLLQGPQSNKLHAGHTEWVNCSDDRLFVRKTIRPYEGSTLQCERES